ncbi:MAG: hypothetical protein F9K43_09075 [Bauldia sp.]|nr:MAG: hypothetical protein F9K43_09075 [Bauldia sp.]MBZ0229340.1 hypothetical protein [Bauldia sp.]
MRAARFATRSVAGESDQSSAYLPTIRLEFFTTWQEMEGKIATDAGMMVTRSTPRASVMEAQTLQMKEDDRRRERRMRCFRGGRIVFNNGFAVFDCVLRNICSGGAMLEMESLLGIPSYFDLLTEPGAPPWHCHVRWRSANQMGVAFDKPH